MGTLYYDILKLCGNNKEKIWNDKSTLKVEYDKNIESFLNNKKVKFTNVIEENNLNILIHIIKVEHQYTPFYLDEWEKLNKRKQREFLEYKNRRIKNRDKYKKCYDIYKKDNSIYLYENVLEDDLYSIIYSLYEEDKKNSCFIDDVYVIINVKDNSDRYTIDELSCIEYLYLKETKEKEI